MTQDRADDVRDANPQPEPTAVDVSVEYVRIGDRGKVRLVVKCSGETYTDSFDVTNAIARRRAQNAIVGRFPGLDVDQIDHELNRIGAEVAGDLSGSETVPEVEAPSGDDAEVLVAIATDANRVELFHVGSRQDAEPYATIDVAGHKETWSVRSHGFGNWLRHQFYERFKRAPLAQKFTDALNTIESRAIYDGVAARVHLRVAGDDCTIYVDLVDDEWNVVRITASGWEIITSSACPVKFYRRRGMLSLPRPERGGSIDELRPFVNCPTADLWCLHVGSLPSFFRPRGPYVVMAYSGEQGSAKSTTSKRTRALIDPSKVAVRRLPRDERDLMIAASNAHLLAFDNLSTIPPNISDALCAIATGGGYGTREMYADDEEKLFNVTRPIILNGIDDVASRPDLIDRAVLLHLPPIPEAQRKEEAALDADFEKARPRILGAIFDAVATAIRRYPSVILERRPRMLDYAKWCSAAETSFGWREGTFLDAYMRNRGDAVALAIEGSPVGSLILSLMRRLEVWEGTAGLLLSDLEKFADEQTKRRPDWPRTPRGMSDALGRIAPALRTLGIQVDRGSRRAGGNRERIVVLRNIRRTDPSNDHGPAAGTDSAEDSRGRDDRDADDRPGNCGSGGVDNEDRDGRDDRDGCVAGFESRDDFVFDGVDSTETGSFFPEHCSTRFEVGTQPSRPSQPSRNANGGHAEADSPGRSRDGGHESGTVGRSVSQAIAGEREVHDA